MPERDSGSKLNAPKWWREAIEKGLDAEVSTVEYFLSKVYTNPETNFQYRVLSVHDGFNFFGVPPGLYAETNITYDKFKTSSHLISPLTTKVVELVFEASKTKGVTVMDVPLPMGMDLPKGATIDLGNTIKVSVWGETEPDGRLIFELNPVPTEETVKGIREALNRNKYDLNRF